MDVYGFVVLMLIKTVAVVGGGCKEKGEDFREETWPFIPGDACRW